MTVPSVTAVSGILFKQMPDIRNRLSYFLSPDLNPGIDISMVFEYRFMI